MSETLLKHIIIGTTAINRPILHKDNIPDWYEWINLLDKNTYRLHWFINIDLVDKLDSTYEETENNFKTMIKEIPTTFLNKPAHRGNFLGACQRITSNIKKYVSNQKLSKENTIIIWLEDDWKLNTKVTIPLQGIIENYLTPQCHINLSFIRNNYIHALAPSILSYRLWEQLHCAAWENQTKHIDPEHCVGRYYLKKFGGKYEELHNLTIITNYKKVSDNYFNKNDFLKHQHSYYTYDITRNKQLKLEHYVDKKEILNFFNDNFLFIRITAGFCVDGVNYGRSFMEKYDIYKKRVQNNNNIDFYASR